MRQNNNNNAFQNENYQRFRKLFEQMSVGLVICTPDGFFVEVNESFCTITGYSKVELGKMTFQEITYPDDLAHELENVKQLIEGKIDNYTIEKRYIRKDKSVRWVKLYVSPIIEENELPIYLMGSVVDITEQKEQDLIRESEAKFQKAFMSNPDPIIIISLSDGRYMDVNDTFLKLYGYKRDEIIGKSSIEVNIWDHPDDRARFVELFNKDGKVRDFETTYRTKNGNQGIVSISA